MLLVVLFGLLCSLLVCQGGRFGSSFGLSYSCTQTSFDEQFVLVSPNISVGSLCAARGVLAFAFDGGVGVIDSGGLHFLR